MVKPSMMDAMNEAVELYNKTADGEKTNGEVISALAGEASEGELTACLALACHLIRGITMATNNLDITMLALRFMVDGGEENR